MSFVTCIGSKCSYYIHLSSPLLIHEIVHGDSIDPFATAFPISVFARVRGIGYHNQMSGDLHRAEVDFRRKMFDLYQKSTRNDLGRLDSEL